MKKISLLSFVVFIFSFWVFPSAVFSQTTASTCTGFETSGACRPELTNSACISGTVNTSGGQCLVNNLGGLQTVSMCTGNETSGPCRPERINQYAAKTAADGIGCTAKWAGVPGVDPNTALNGYWYSDCGGSGEGSESTGAVVVKTVSAASIMQNTYDQLYSGTQSAAKKAINSFLRLPLDTPIDFATLGTPAGLVGGTTSSCYVFTTTMQIGSTSSELPNLVKALKADGQLPTLFVTPATFDISIMLAVSTFQLKYKDDILEPLGLSVATGLVGSSTRAKLNSLCLVRTTIATTPTTGGTVATSTCTTSTSQNSGIRGGAYRYTFTRSGGSWKVTLNNPVYGSVGNPYYVPANFFFIATSSAHLNRQNQDRFNTNLPGIAYGNQEYDRLFGSFINAYYDWGSLTTTTTGSSTCTTPPTGVVPSTPTTVLVNPIRYVKITVTDQETIPMTLREIIVEGQNSTTIHPTTITATAFDGIYQMPGNLIDGNENTTWRSTKSTCVLDDCSDRQVITLDLGQLVSVNRIKVINYAISSTRNIIFDVSKDGSVYKQIADVRASYANPFTDRGVISASISATATF